MAAELLAQDGVVLVHVSHVVGSREAERPVLVERHVIEGDRDAEVAGERRRVLRTGEHVTSHAEALTGGLGPAPEDAVGAPADVLRRYPRQLAAAERQREHDVAVGTFSRTLTEI